MDTFQVIFHVLLLCLQSLCAGLCYPKFTKLPLYGYRCMDNSNNVTEVSMYQTDRPQCVWKCLKMEMCRHLSHYHDTAQCILGLGECEFLTLSPGGSVNVFGPPRGSCLHWGSRQEYGRVPVAITGRSQLARITTGDAVLVGAFDIDPGKFWANNVGVLVGPVYESDPDIEFLTVDPACSLPWMPYTAGESLPTEVITGGHLSDGSIAYVIRVTVNDFQQFGYYHAESELGYYARIDAISITSMEILLLI